MTMALQDIEAAAARLEPVIIRTPLLTSPALDAAVSGSVLIKPECLQLTGSFKIRGAYNRLCQLDREQRPRGAVAWSSGNHAQGVAAAGAMLGIETTIVMPEDAPRAKIESTRRLGGRTVLYDRYTGDREAIAREIAAETGAQLVPSFDHTDVIAGQGTVGLEIVQQGREAGIEPDQVLIPCGGGGLSSGTAIAISALSPGTDVYVVEPEDFDDTARSFESGEREMNDPAARSICDALLSERPGAITFAINRNLIKAGLVVSDDEVREAMRFAFRNLKLVVEPGGAVALAAILSGKVQAADRISVVVLSGGNVDAEVYASIQTAGSDTA